MKRAFLIILLFCCCFALMAQQPELFIDQSIAIITGGYTATLFRTNWRHSDYNRPEISLDELDNLAENLYGKNYRWGKSYDVLSCLKKLEHAGKLKILYHDITVAAIGSWKKNGCLYVPGWHRSSNFGNFVFTEYAYWTCQDIQQPKVRSKHWVLVVYKEDSKKHKRRQ